jgi:hypothetical protein
MLVPPALRRYRKAHFPLPARVSKEVRQALTASVMQNLSWHFFTGSIDLFTGQ